MDTPTQQWPEGVLVVTPAADTKSPMWRKMWQRAGYDPESVRWADVRSLDGFGDAPQLIALGEEALNRICGEHDLFRWRGRMVPSYRWSVPRTVLATLRVVDMLPRAFSPGALATQLTNRPSRFQGTWVRDIQYAISRSGTFTHNHTNYLLDPKNRSEWERWVARVLAEGTLLAFDIETQYTPKSEQDEEDQSDIPQGAILRIAFSNAPHTAASVPWNAEFLPGIRQLLASDLPKAGWNCAAFDVPRLEKEGFPVGGRIYDFQDAWHLLQSDLPKGLEWVSSFYTHVTPWKHLSDQQPALYAAIDADVTIQNALGITADLKAAGQWELFERHVTDLMPVLYRAGVRGNQVDLTYQQNLKIDMEAEKGRLIDEVQALVPDEVRPTRRVKTAPDADTPHRVVLVPGKVKVCAHCLQIITSKTEHHKGKKAENPCKGAAVLVEEAQVPEYDLLEPFNLGSSQQLLAYARHHKHPVGTNPKTKQPTMDKTQLEKLAKKCGSAHPIYQAALDYSKVAKTLSTYMYTPDSAGLIHTTYVNAPSTWRLASRNVNLQNVGKRESNPWAKKARRQIVARPGHIFVQADSTSIEAVVTGYLIGDPTFTAVAKKSIHAYLVCAELGLEFTDAHVELVKKAHKTLYNQFKTAVYLLLYGGDPYLMYATNPELYPTKRAAEEIQQKIFALMPKLPEWQTRVREQAKREGVLQSPWGYRHHFYDVYTFKRDATGAIQFTEDGSPIIKLGNDAKRALAFVPQNCAGAFCRDTLLLIGQSSWGRYMPANVSVHDGYTLEVPEAMAADAAQFLIDTLTRPVLELGGLRIGCEVDQGYNWADWSEDNPRGMTTLCKVEA